MTRSACRTLVLAVGAVSLVASVTAQTPRPFPTPSRPDSAPPPPQAPVSAPPSVDPAVSGAPTEAMLGLPVYPTAQFITSYDAGRGQRFYLFGVLTSFSEIVAYYRNVLGSGGNRVFEEPATYTFEVGSFRDEAMAFPPGVTVKDYTWGGSAGYLNPVPGTTPQRFPTVIQIVPAPAGSR